MESLGRTMMMMGILLIVIGGIVFLGSKLGLGRLPGDIYYKKENFTFYFPVMTSIIASIVLTVLLNLLFRR
ncbi:Protein of unknown function [Geosporobacter subterraneus DSM 17957]|uniref:DUF2905 domain-containing protein n=1 Tax=Geosporobacter subterraneus DSM 17957 TaxID=1121919 RepID=A0A1M6BQZ0_9FIRM|nr:DUF2905 domain-containing protein [Geosporobacter subterraneus]SHI51175.1 Protein of unknown function [Geosporobacter subterraneus DSM 17957]